MRDGFIIHDETMEQLALLTDEEAGQLLKALAAHYRGEERPETERTVQIVLINAEDRMDADADWYAKKSKSGKEGMAKRWQSDNTAITPPYQSDNTAITSDSDSVSDSVSDSEKTKKKEGARFAPPTLEEVREYCQERGNGVDPEAFVDYYASQKWKKANGQPVSDWKGCVRTWEKRDKEKPAREPPKKAYQIEGRKYSNDELERMLLGGRA